MEGRLVATRWTDWWDSSTLQFLLDIRVKRTEPFATLIHPTLVQVSIPFVELENRLSELPPRNVGLAVWHDTECDITKMGDLLKNWTLHGIFLDTPDLRSELEASGIQQSSLSDNSVPLPRLWAPDSMVSRVLLPLLQVQISNANSQIWDMGAGFGRDACFLAEELLSQPGKNSSPPMVVAWDQRYRNVERNETTLFFKRRRVEALTKCRCCNLEQVDSILSQVTPSVACIYMVRYFNSALFRALLEHSVLEKGALLAVCQFCKPTMDAPWDFPHPSPKHVLERDDLTNMVQSSCHNWKIVHNEIVSDSDWGRTLIQFVVQKEGPR